MSYLKIPMVEAKSLIKTVKGFVISAAVCMWLCSEICYIPKIKMIFKP